MFDGGLGWPIASALTAISFLSSFITVAFGIGGGTVMLAALASLLPAPAIIPVHGLVQLGSNAGRAAMMRAFFPPGILVPFSIGALIGVAIGGLFVMQLPAGAIKLGLGLFILWSITFDPPGFLRRSAWLVGLVSSFLTMFFGGTGVFVATYTRALPVSRQAYVAAHATLMTVQHGLKTLMFGFLGFAFAQWAGFIALLILAGLAGTWAGKLVLHRLDEKVFRRALNVLLGLLALRLIWDGAMSLWG